MKIEVEVVVTRYIPAVPPHRNGHPDNWEPGQDAEYEYEIVYDHDAIVQALEEQRLQESDN